MSTPIAAIATATGRGGVGIVRVSGLQLSRLVHRLFQRDLLPRHAHFLPFKTVQGEIVDEGLALFFPAPHSYTGEDVLELHGHGGPAVLRRVLELCLSLGSELGLRLAEPGEFTQRAFLNGRLDLAQAEAVADLIEATSEAAARGAMASLSGVFSNKVNALADRIMHLRMLVEATLDFPEEEIDFLEKYQARPLLHMLCSDLQDILVQTRQGVRLRQGLHVVLVGQPNVGKSSLLNALAGDEIAIVTPIAGTTRDKVTQEIYLDDLPVHVVDTAGLRPTEDPIEQIGIARAWQEIARADVIVHVQDATANTAEADAWEADFTTRLSGETVVLSVLNKVDINATSPRRAKADLCISAYTGEGLAALRRRLVEIAGIKPSGESLWLARERHLRALQQSAAHLAQATQCAEQDDRVLDLFAEELRLAHESLSSITGKFTSEDLLGEIFSRFCIGK
jgi:tRNA modification GTPase